MFEHARSAARGEMTTRGLYVFKHGSELGNPPAHKLFELIQAKKNSDKPARDFSDIEIDHCIGVGWRLGAKADSN